MTNEMPFEYSDSWVEAKRQVDSLKFPSEINLFKLDGSITHHYAGKTKHNVSYYRATLPSIQGYTLEASYIVCKECTERVISQKFYLSNNSENTVYIRELIKEKREY